VATKRIVKYHLKIDNSQKIKMYKEAVILDIDVEGEEVSLVCLADEADVVVGRHFITYGINYPVLRDDITYVGKYALNGFPLRFYVFEQL
jgi:hypothetical protein